MVVLLINQRYVDETILTLHHRVKENERGFHGEIFGDSSDCNYIQYDEKKQQ